MNTSNAVETASPFSFKETLSKVVPESIIKRTLFWGALPAVLLLFTIGVSFSKVTVFSQYLPFFALLGGLSCLRWKTVGLIATYLALTFLVLVFFQDIPPQHRLWQMGIVFALAVDYFILLLAAEEIEALVGRLKESAKRSVKELNQSQLQMQQLEQEWTELKQQLEDEIKQLKEEAEQRRIERHEESKRIELIQSEIELLTSQKESILAQARSAPAVEKSVDLRKLEGMHKQLRSQFDQKACTLSETRIELFYAQEKLLAYEHQQKLNSLEPESKEIAYYEQELNRLVNEVSCHEEEIIALEGLVSSTINSHIAVF